MRKPFLFLSLTSVFACGSGDAASTQRDNTLAIQHVTVIDVAGGPSRPDQTVLISGNRIAALGNASDVKVPRGLPRIDATGKYLIPGLWDMHTHVVMFGPTGLSLYLANGVTGIRDMGVERFADAKALRDSIAAGQRPGPRMRIASPVVENPRWLAAVKQMGEKAGTPWRLYERFGPSSAEQAVRWVDSVVALGANHIKVRNWPAIEIGQALVARARERGIQVVGHGNEPFPRSGISSIEHGIWPPLKVSDAARDSMWRKFAALGVAVDPTLVTWPIRLDPPDTLLAKLTDGRIAGTKYVPPAALQGWRDQLAELKQETGSIDWRAVYQGELRNVGELHRAGVTLLAGTDVGAPLIVPGFSLHDELGFLVSVGGLTPLQSLQAATIKPAEFMRLTDSVGTIAVGKLADLVLLDADPLTDIGNTRKISVVVANGKVFDRAALDRMLEGRE